MGLFKPKPYKLDNLSQEEMGVALVALDAAIHASSENASIKKKMETAKRHAKSGALTREDLLITVFCLKTLLKVVDEHDSSNDSLEVKRAGVRLKESATSAAAKLEKLL